MHHDEAINSVFLQQLWEKGEYRYSPLRFHGPSLSFLALPLVWVSPAESYRQTRELTYRMLPMFAGVVLVLLTLGLGSGIGRSAAFLAAALCALSPGMVFYSRYYIHEMLLVVFTFSAIGSGWQLLRELAAGRSAWRWALALGASLGMMHATKETFIIAVASAALGLAASVRPIRVPRGLPSHLALTVGAAAAVSVLFFSSFFTHAGGPLDSIATFTRYLQQGTDVESGFAQPWTWYLELLVHYEAGGVSFSSEAVIVLLAIVGIFAAARGWWIEPDHVPLARFFAVYTLAMLAIYSAIPYKTPWCVLSPLHGIIVLGGIGAISLLRAAKSPGARVLVASLMVLGVAQLAHQSYLLNFRYASDERSLHVFSHTDPAVREVAALITSLARLRDGERRPSTHVFNWGGNGGLYFYLRGLDRVRFHNAEETHEASASMSMFLIHESQRGEIDPRLEVDYHVERFALRPGRWGLLFVRRGLWDALGAAPAT